MNYELCIMNYALLKVVERLLFHAWLVRLLGLFNFQFFIFNFLIE